MSDTALFDDTLNVKDIDPDGKKFDRVSRIFCESESYGMDLILDVNTMIYPIQLGDKLKVHCTRSLNEDGSTDDGEFNPLARYPKMDAYDYVMYGKVYRILPDNADAENSPIAVYVSFGGLLMRLHGDASHLSQFEIDQSIYLLVKKFRY